MARRWAAVAIGMGHTGLFILAATDTLTYTVPTTFHFLALLADSHAWLFIHATIAILIAVALIRKRGEIQAMSLSAGFMGAWGVFTFLVGLTTIHPVSLAAPVLGLTLAGVAYAVAGSWGHSNAMRGRD